MTALLRDAMTPRQRLAAYGRGEAVDRLPAVPIVGNTAARVLGVKVSAFRGNGQLIAAAQIGAYRRFGYDIIRIFTDLYAQAEAMGATVIYPEDETAISGNRRYSSLRISRNCARPITATGSCPNCWRRCAARLMRWVRK